MAATSEPAPGSDEQNEASCGSSIVPNIWGSHSPNCSGVPLAASDAAASPVPKMDSPMPASPQNISSNTASMPRPLGSACWVTINSIEYTPTFAASWMIGHGVSSRSSHSAAAGRMTFAAKSCTQSRTWMTSSESSSENDMATGPFGDPFMAGANRVGLMRTARGNHPVNECTSDHPASCNGRRPSRHQHQVLPR